MKFGRRKPWAQAGIVAGIDGLGLILLEVFLLTQRPEAGYPPGLRQFIVSLLRWTHEPLAGPLFWAVDTELLRRPELWPWARPLVLLAAWTGCTANTFLLAWFGFSWHAWRRPGPVSGLSLAQHFALKAWAAGRPGEPFSAEKGTREADPDALRPLKEAVAGPAALSTHWIEARAEALGAMRASLDDGDYWLLLGELTLRIEEECAHEPDAAAVRFGLRCLQRARVLGPSGPALWLAELRWLPPGDKTRLRALESLRVANPRHVAVQLERLADASSAPAERRLEELRRQGFRETEARLLEARLLEDLRRDGEALALRRSLLKAEPENQARWRAYLASPALAAGHDPEAPEPGLRPADRPHPSTWLLPGLPPVRRDQRDRSATVILGAALILLALPWLKLRALNAQPQPAEPYFGRWKAVALVREDGSRMPYAHLPPWMGSYSQRAGQDFADYTRELQVRGAPPAMQILPSGRVDLDFGCDGALQWARAVPGLLIQADGAAGFCAVASMEEDGLKLSFAEREIGLLMQKEGAPAAPLRWTDWYRAPPLYSIRGRTYIRTRGGELRPLLNRQPGVVEYGAGSALGGLAVGEPYYVLEDGSVITNDMQDRQQTIFKPEQPEPGMLAVVP